MSKPLIAERSAIVRFKIESPLDGLSFRENRIAGLRVVMSVISPFDTSRDVRCSVAIGGSADVSRAWQDRSE